MAAPSGTEFSASTASRTLADVDLAAEALDRAEACRERIDRDGEMISTKGGMRKNPLLKSELASRAFVVRTLARLGLNFEPVRPSVGRPGRGLGSRGTE
jgi:hypothetical protein